MIKKILYSLFILAFVLISINPAQAYVRVKGYTRSDGTYVKPHVRSNPNGLKYDNYSWTPSQGLYNKTYGTRGSDWDTPTSITDPDYYEGKRLYESGQTGLNLVPPMPTKEFLNIVVPLNAHLDFTGSNWVCDDGYKKNYTANKCEPKIIANELSKLEGSNKAIEGSLGSAYIPSNDPPKSQEYAYVKFNDLTTVWEYNFDLPIMKPLCGNWTENDFIEYTGSNKGWGLIQNYSSFTKTLKDWNYSVGNCINK